MSREAIIKAMEKLYAQQKQGKTIWLNNKVLGYTLGAIEALNEGIENNARFSTFRASRHYAGRTKARSAYAAVRQHHATAAMHHSSIQKHH